MTRLAVVGASGFVGSVVLRHLQEHGHEVVPVRAPRLRSTTTSLDELRADLGSCEDAIRDLTHAFEDCSGVINAAGLPDADSGVSPELIGANSLLPALVGRAAHRAGVKRFVHVSSATVQGHAKVLRENEATAPFSPYSLSKALGEQLLLSDGQVPSSTVIVRPVSVQAASRRTTQRLAVLARGPFASVAGAGEGPAPLTLVENAAAAIAFVATYDGDDLPPVVLQPGDGLSVRDALSELGATRVRTVPSWLARSLVTAGRCLGRAWPRFNAEARRVEMLWFGQAFEATWLSDHGFLPPVGREGWRRLAGSHVASTGSPRLLAMVTIAPSVRHFLGGQLAHLANSGYDVTVLSSPGPDLLEVAARDGVRPIPFPMHREISPLRDVMDVLRMVRTLRTLRPDIVNYGTPKASLLGSLAAWLTRVPVRVYTLHGLRLETTTGFRRAVLYLAEWVSCRTAHRVICVSPSLREEALRLRLVSRRRAVVLGSGTCNGVQVERFADSLHIRAKAEDIRSDLALPPESPVIGFVGRLTRDKGIPELISVFRRLRISHPGARLLLVGDFEQGDPVPPAVRQEIASSPDIVVTGMLAEPGPYYHLMDVLALPTYREGFGGVILEAAVSGVTAVATRTTGTVDAVLDGVTGLLVDPGDEDGLAHALSRLLDDARERTNLATAARERAIIEFNSQLVWRNVASLYRDLATGVRNSTFPIPKSLSAESDQP